MRLEAGKSRVFDATDLRPIRAWLLGAASGIHVVEADQEDTLETHYDTSGWRFHRAGLSLRICRTREEYEARTLPIGDARLAEATEAVEANSIEVLQTCPGPVGDRVRSLTGGDELKQLFELQSLRQRFRVLRGDEELASVVLDEIAIPMGEQGYPVRLKRVEITPAEGQHRELNPWFESLRASFGLQPAIPSLHTAALRALGLAPPAPPELGSTKNVPEQSAGETAFIALRTQFGKCLAHDPGTRLGEDIEELHDMRVASRRMRAAMKLYATYLPQRVLALQKELAWLGRALGEVRDLDVYQVQLQVWRDELPEADRPALDALRTIVSGQWTTARRRMLRALGSRRFARLVERTTGALRVGPASTSHVAQTPILEAAPEMIEKRYGRVVKPGRQIAADSPEEAYHRLRIRCKALRYAMEFHRSLYGARSETMIRRLVALQDLLGDHQDAAVASMSLRGLVGNYGRRLPPETLFVVGMLAERYARRAETLRRRFPRLFRRMRGRRWKRLKTAMAAARPEPEPLRALPRPAGPASLAAPEAAEGS